MVRSYSRSEYGEVMSLKDFLGSTYNIIIIDFLAENSDLDYNQTEISACTGIPKPIVHEKLAELILNNIVKISDLDNKKFRLNENDLVDHLIKSALNHSFIMAEENILSEDERYKQIYGSIESDDDEKIDVYIGE